MVVPLGRRRLLGGAAAAALGTVAAAVHGERASAGTTVPADPYPPVSPHLTEAEHLVDYLRHPACPAANNDYKDPTQPNNVVWGEPGRPETFFVQAQCASFLTAVLMRTYPDWATPDFYRTHFGSISPVARTYRAKWAAGTVPHFTIVPRVDQLRPGDLIAIDYLNDKNVNTGHVVLVRRLKATYVAPIASLNFPGETQYAVEIVDCTSEPHGTPGIGNYDAFPDTRIVGDVEGQGAGYGHMMLYASNTTGAITRYRWSVNSRLDDVHGNGTGDQPQLLVAVRVS